MKFNKLALAAAVAAAPTAGLAMEPMEDAALSGVTGQDGISISINDGAGGLGMDVLVHDTDGIADDAAAPAFNNFAGYGNAGAIVMDGMVVNAASTMEIAIDAGSDATGAGNNMLNVNVSFPTGVQIQTGAVGVAGSARDNAAWGVDEASIGAATTVFSNSTIDLGSGTALNIQLGTEAQGNMISVASTIATGLTLSNVSVNDADSGGSLGATSVTVVDNGGANLNLAIGVDATAAGLAIDMSNQGPMDLRIVDAYLGSTGAGIVGDVEVVGLDLSSTTITVSGK